MMPWASARSRVATRSNSLNVMAASLLAAAGATLRKRVGARRLAEIVLPHRLLRTFERGPHVGLKLVSASDLLCNRRRLQPRVHRRGFVTEFADCCQRAWALAALDAARHLFLHLVVFVDDD